MSVSNCILCEAKDNLTLICNFIGDNRFHTSLKDKIFELAGVEEISPTASICINCANNVKISWKMQRNLKREFGEPSIGGKIRILKNLLSEFTESEKCYVVLDNNDENDKILMIDMSSFIKGETCEEEDIHNCNHCDEQFVDGAELIVHKERHNADDPYYCHLCRKTCENRLAYYTHCLNHSQCNICGLKAPNESELVDHQCHPKCNGCNIIFMNINDLKRHTQVEHNVSSVKPPYICSTCFKLFKTQSQMSKHTHAPDKTYYMCGVLGCSSKFHIRDALINHLRTDHKNNAFSEDNGNMHVQQNQIKMKSKENTKKDVVSRSKRIPRKRNMKQERKEEKRFTEEHAINYFETIEYLEEEHVLMEKTESSAE